MVQPVGPSIQPVMFVPVQPITRVGAALVEQAKQALAQIPQTAMPQAQALSTAVAQAAGRQDGLAPLMADLGQAVDTPQMPAPVRAAAAEVLKLQTPLRPDMAAPAVRQAVSQSGLFLEARLAATPQTPPGPDLKAALLVLRQVLVQATPAQATRPETAAPTAAPAPPAVPAPVAATVPQTPATVAAPATAAATPLAGAATPPPATTASPSGAPVAAAPALAATTAQPAASPTPLPAAAAAPLPSAAPAMAAIPNPAVAAAPAASAETTDPALAAVAARGPAPAPAASQPAAAAPQAATLAAAAVAKGPAPPPVSALPLPIPSTAPPAAATAAAGASQARETLPPPYRGGPTRAQRAATPTLPAGASAPAMTARLLQQTDAALAREELLQAASMPEGSRRAEAKPDEVRTEPARWMLDIPVATPQGPAVAQMEISRDGRAPGAAPTDQPVWRVRFSIDAEPLGPVHAAVVLNNGQAHVGLWAERPDSALDLRGRMGELTTALSEAADTVEVSVYTGAPPQAAPQAGRLVDQSS